MMSVVRVIKVLERRPNAEIACERETWRRGKQDKIALFQLKHSNPVKIKKARPVEHETEGRILVARFANIPRARSGDYL